MTTEEIRNSSEMVRHGSCLTSSSTIRSLPLLTFRLLETKLRITCPHLGSSSSATPPGGMPAACASSAVGMANLNVMPASRAMGTMEWYTPVTRRGREVGSSSTRNSPARDGEEPEETTFGVPGKDGDLKLKVLPRCFLFTHRCRCVPA